MLCFAVCGQSHSGLTAIFTSYCAFLSTLNQLFMQTEHANNIVTDQQATSMTEAGSGTSKAPALLQSWEVPQECVLERLELWQKGHYGPVCKGQLKNRDGASSAVVVKSLRGTAWNINIYGTCKHFCTATRIYVHIKKNKYFVLKIIQFCCCLCLIVLCCRQQWPVRSAGVYRLDPLPRHSV